MTSNKTLNSALTYLLIWLGFSLIGFSIGFIALYSPKNERIARNGIQTYGTAIAKEPENHQGIIYSFSVNGVKYESSGRGSNGNPSFDEIEIGDKLLIYYNPENPKESYLGNPQRAISDFWHGVLFLTIIFPIFPTITTIRYIRRRSEHKKLQ